MYPMIQSRLKEPVTRMIVPICRGALRLGISANVVTFLGALGVIASSFYFFPRGELLLGTLAISLFALSDLFDGTLARLSNSSGTKWGALLDSTLDRISDAAIGIGIWAYLRGEGGASQFVALAVLVLGGLIPYIRARAESLGIACNVGLAERAERLIVLMIGTGLAGLGLALALPVALWVLLLLSLVTVAQRMWVVYRA